MLTWQLEIVVCPLGSAVFKISKNILQRNIPANKNSTDCLPSSGKKRDK